MSPDHAFPRAVVVLPRISYVGRYAGMQASVGEVRAELELMVVREGSVEVELDGERASGGPGTCFVYPRRSRPHKRTMPRMSTTFIFFDAPASVFVDDFRAIRPAPHDPVLRWVEDACDLFHAAGAGPSSPAAALLRTILERLNQVERRQRAAADVHPALAAAIALIQRDPAAAVSVPEVAKASGVSASHLGSLFRRQFGCGPLAYQQQLRMERARRLLHDPYLSIAEVAQACGYDTANYFLRVFRRTHGKPPGRWRRDGGGSSS